MRRNSKIKASRPKSAKPSLTRRIIQHFAMGAALGLLLGLCLLHFDVANIRDMIDSGFDPGSTRAILAMGLALQFGIGAALTGFALELENA